eukprot:1157452-Pelagomonas_calceolata.AAC.3
MMQQTSQIQTKILHQTCPMPRREATVGAPVSCLVQAEWQGSGPSLNRLFDFDYDFDCGSVQWVGELWPSSKVALMHLQSMLRADWCSVCSQAARLCCV